MLSNNLLGLYGEWYNDNTLQVRLYKKGWTVQFFSINTHAYLPINDNFCTIQLGLIKCHVIIVQKNVICIDMSNIC